MAEERMDARQFEQRLSCLAGVDILAAIRAAVEGIDADSPRYEEALRKKVVLDGNVIPQSRPADAPVFFIDSLGDLLVEALSAADLPRSPYLVPAAFVWFEWNNRNNSDRRACLAAWEDMFMLMAGADDLLDASILAYAESRWLVQAGKTHEALEAARRASDAAPHHPGFLNNYGEILVAACKEDIFREDQEGEAETSLEERRDLEIEADRASDRFRELKARLEGADDYDRYWRPSFIVTREMLQACSSPVGLLGDDGGFDDARALLRHLHATGDEVFGDESRYIAEMGRISNMQSQFFLIGNVKRMKCMAADQRRDNARTAERMEQLDRKVTDNRISIIETLGFFSAIIALIITSVQAGEGLSFGLRALFVMVLAGALLIAFGALDIIIAPYRDASDSRPRQSLLARIPDRTRMLWLIGSCVIVLGCALAFLPYPA